MTDPIQWVATLEVSLPPLHELEPAPRRKGFRMAPWGWPGRADAVSPVFQVGAAELWRAWIEFAAPQPRTVLRAEDEDEGRSLRIQRSPLLASPIWCVPRWWRSEPSAPAWFSTGALASAAGISA